MKSAYCGYEVSFVASIGTRIYLSGVKIYTNTSVASGGSVQIPIRTSVELSPYHRACDLKSEEGGRMGDLVDFTGGLLQKLSCTLAHCNFQNLPPTKNCSLKMKKVNKQHPNIQQLLQHGKEMKATNRGWLFDTKEISI